MLYVKNLFKNWERIMKIRYFNFEVVRIVWSQIIILTYNKMNYCIWSLGGAKQTVCRLRFCVLWCSESETQFLIERLLSSARESPGFNDVKFIINTKNITCLNIIFQLISIIFNEYPYELIFVKFNVWTNKLINKYKVCIRSLDTCKAIILYLNLK